MGKNPFYQLSQDVGEKNIKPAQDDAYMLHMV